jgi:hypothetical protein
MNDEKLINAIKRIEDYYFGEGEDCGERLFIDFARKNRQAFLGSKLNNSSENDFIFTELHNQFQTIYESKLESLVISSDLTVDEFYEMLKLVNKLFYLEM